MSESDDKKKLAEQIERFGDAHRAQLTDMFQKMLRALADSAERIAAPHADDASAKEWVDLTRRAATDLRNAADRFQIQAFAPHGEVPS